MHDCLPRLVAIFAVIGPLAGVSCLAGCGSEDPPKQRDLPTHIGLNDVMGKWQLTKGSLDLLKRDGYVEAPDPTYTIDFNKDGWLRFQSVLDDVKGGTYTNCLGTWQLQYDVIVQNEQRPNVVELQLLRPNSRYFLKLSVTEDDGNLRLWNTYGESKLGQYIEYERPGVKPKVGW